MNERRVQAQLARRKAFDQLEACFRLFSQGHDVAEIAISSKEEGQRWQAYLGRYRKLSTSFTLENLHFSKEAQEAYSTINLPVLTIWRTYKIFDARRKFNARLTESRQLP